MIPKFAKIGLILAALLAGPAHAEFVASYAYAKTPQYRRIAAEWQRAGILERMADLLNSYLRVPGTVSLVLDECGQSNAFYKPSSQSVVLCHELISEVSNSAIRDFKDAPYEYTADIVGGTLLFIVFHEVGHALIDVLSLPNLGREEDAADSIATYFQLKSHMKSSSILGASWFFERMSPQMTNQQFSDEHSFGPQRTFNILCWAYGSDPETFSEMAQRAGLSAQRASRCSREYAGVESSVRTLLGRNLRR